MRADISYRANQRSLNVITVIRFIDLGARRMKLGDIKCLQLSTLIIGLGIAT